MLGSWWSACEVLPCLFCISSCFPYFSSAFSWCCTFLFSYFLFFLSSGEIPYELMIYADMCNTTSFGSYFGFLSVFVSGVTWLDRQQAIGLASCIWAHPSWSALRVLSALNLNPISWLAPWKVSSEEGSWCLCALLAIIPCIHTTSSHLAARVFVLP